MRALAAGVAGVLLLVGVAGAEEARAVAKSRYEQGLKLYNLTDYRGAREAFKAAYLAVPEPAFLFNLGQCARMLGETEEALRLYRNYLRAAGEVAQRAEVEQLIADQETLLRRRAEERPPVGIAPPPATSPPLVVSARPPSAPSRRWIWIVVGAAVVASALAIGLGVGLANDVPAPPSTTLGNLVVWR